MSKFAFVLLIVHVIAVVRLAMKSVADRISTKLV